MKNLLTTISCFLSIAIYAQINITGTVYDIDNKLLEGASVYINNTSIGTTTNAKGEFTLNIPKGTYQLVVSYIGFESKRRLINTNNYKGSISFKLIAKNNVLDEVVIKRKKKLSNSKRKAFLRRFRKAFLGESKFAKNSRILNERVIDFDFDPYNNILEVDVSEPLKIVNEALGYVIYYDLTYFKLTPLNVNHLGYARYEKIEGSKKLMKKWKKNRVEAYNGSKIHFLRSVMKERVEEEGFVVDQIKRIPNPERPTYEEVVTAQKFLAKKGGLQRNPIKSSIAQDQKLLEARELIEKFKLPEFVDELIEKNIGLLKYGLINNSKFYLQFSEYLRVTYTKESPDKNYKSTQEGSKYPVSLISLFNKFAEIHKSGVFKRPLNVFTQGYWAFEKVGDALPLDYSPD